MVHVAVVKRHAGLLGRVGQSLDGTGGGRVQTHHGGTILLVAFPILVQGFGGIWFGQQRL